MDVTFVLSAIIFTLLAIVVATSLLNGSSPAVELVSARSYFGQRGAGAEDQPAAKQNGHVPEKKKKKEEATTYDWSEISGSSHDHWDVVKSVQSVSIRSVPPGLEQGVRYTLFVYILYPDTTQPRSTDSIPELYNKSQGN